MQKFSKKDQHFVPRFYLKNFTYDGKYCYTKNKSGKINSQNIKEICKRRNIYEIKDKNNNILNKNYAENTLAVLDEYFNTFLTNFIK